jgi:UDP-GlcNAc:undecaprenyl-phosphate/decaprenyl-phosphate GlcNAc-1-phosphate transferase
MAWLDLLAALAVAAAASAAACRVMVLAGVTDAPSMARKIHRTPTATSGGLGAAIGFCLGVLALTFPPVRAWSVDLAPDEAMRMAGAVGLAAVFMAIGLYDDLRPMGPKTKLALFAAASLAAPFLVGGPDNLAVSDGFVIRLGPVLAVLGAALWMFVLVNAVNFLDGVNGLALGSCAIGFVALALMSATEHAPHVAALALIGAGAVGGFLIWNFPHAKLFAGDAGALFAGALAATMSLMAIEDGGLSPFTPPALFFPMLADALLTLVWRLGRGRRLLDGHREHFFHIAVRAGWATSRVTLTYWALAAGCGVLAIAAHYAQRAHFLPLSERGGWLEGVLTAAPALVLGLMIIVAIVVSVRVRRFAAGRNLDTE